MCRPVIAVIIGLLLGSAAHAAVDDDLLSTLRRQLDTGDLAGALLTARQAVTVHPSLPGLWYNLAGLEQRHGDPDRAQAAFERGVILGFDDFRHADEDPDLGDLTATPRYRDLRAAWADGLAIRRADRGLTVEQDAWTTWQPLPDGSGGAGAEFRLRVDPDGLALDLRLADDDLPPRPPWQSGGGGVLVSVVLPEDASTGEGRQAVDLGFGWQDGLPSGALLLAGRWQRLAELSPKLKLDHELGCMTMAVRIPWQACGSLHPLVDPGLSVNIVYVRQDGVQRRAALLADPGLGRADRAWRRGVPLQVHWATHAPAVQARLDDLVVRDESVDLAIAALGPADAVAPDIHVVLHDRRGQPVHDVTVPLARRGALLTAKLELPRPALAGSARLGVSLGIGTRRGLSTWERTLVSLPPGWEAAAERRIADAPDEERASMTYRLDAVASALASRLPRDDAGALGTTLDELETLLARVAATGSALPSGGGFLALVPATATLSPIPCSLALPPGWQRGHQGPLLLLLARAPGAEERAINLAHRLLAERAAARGVAVPPLILAIPHLPAEHDTTRARARVDQLLDWLTTFLEPRPVHVAAVDLLAAAALEVAADRAHDLAGLLLFSGLNFVPFPGEGPSDLAGRVADVPADLPVGWIWFPDEIGAGDQAAPLRRALEAGGHRLSPRLPVSGGLGFDQAWTRAVLWAGGLSQP